MLDTQKNIIRTGYRKMPDANVTVPRPAKAVTNFKYPINELGVPKEGLNDSLAICEYSKEAMRNIGSYIRQVIFRANPENQYVMRKENIDGTDMVLIYRTK